MRNSLRMMPSEIIETIDRGNGPEAWMDLFEDFPWNDDRVESDAVLRQCARFLHQEFPGLTWGWQDFDKLLSQTLNNRYPTISAAGEQWALDDDLTDDEFVAIQAEGPGDFTRYAVQKGARWIEVDDSYGGVLVFLGIKSIDDVRR